MRVFTDEVDVIEGKACVGHDGSLSAGREKGPAPAPGCCGSVVPGGDARNREDRSLEGSSGFLLYLDAPGTSRTSRIQVEIAVQSGITEYNSSLIFHYSF